jgi:hypothetical protein
MRLQVLHIPGCPNADLLTTRLVDLVCGRVPVEEKVIQDQSQATAWGMHGSPTLLIDGVDPFASGDLPAVLACRLYRDHHGAPIGAPTVPQLRTALSSKGVNHD